LESDNLPVNFPEQHPPAGCCSGFRSLWLDELQGSLGYIRLK
jgi:hypothetical protein